MTTTGRERRWPLIVSRSVQDLFANDGLAWAAALSFFALLSFFPVVIVIIIVASYVTDPQWVGERIVNGVNEFVPAEQIDPVALVDGAQQQRERLGVIAVVLILITGRRILGTLTSAMDRMSDVDQRDDTFRRRVLTEGALVIGIVSVAGLAVATRPLLALAERVIGLTTTAQERVTLALTETLQTLLIFGTFTLVYATVPLGKRMWRAVLIASAVVTGLFLATRAAFTAVVELLWESLAILYGPLAAAAFLLTWVYWVALIVLFGASLSSHIKVMHLEGASSQEAEQRHVPRTDGPTAGATPGPTD
ncbi:MAG: hypothetical protein AVDCRST_MAG33-1643 [uncultured Thermomicrobiales bacterium]|uniref:Uncharacterized protein n=1 Tax=uncultured Thermomicrobiales bacterium TaxID=1645740 RepID=A0A6J4UU86_9BACT|nr:MAG: hypothetical protein AVDCRST_MAG33-1643 [uncultured Thermomicrobiales bacterium]